MRTWMVMLVLSSSLAAAQPGAETGDVATNERVAATRERAAIPKVREVIEAAYRAAGLDRELGRGMARRARLAGLVPWLSVRAARDTAWRELEPEVGRSTTVEVRATWRLDRLVFEPRELGVTSLEAARRRERRRLAKQVIRVYFAWRLAEAAEQAEEAAAELDALTDGWFARAANLPEA